MKFRIIAAAVLVVAVSLFGACTKKENATETTASKKPEQIATVQSTTIPSTTVQLTTFVTEATTAEPSTTGELSTTAPSTTKAPATTKASTTKVPSTTKKSNIATTDRGRVYKDSQIEVVELRYGVVEHRYKTVYYQMIDGERVDVGYEYTGGFINRRNYSATYEDLLPAARENRVEYSDYIEENLRIINSYRAAKGIAPLKLNEKMTIMACARAEEIAWSGEHSHRRPDGSMCFTIFKDAGYETGTAGENLGYVFDNPEDVCLAWKESRTHYKNLMNPDFTEVGIGVAADPDERGKLCWANHFITAE